MSQPISASRPHVEQKKERHRPRSGWLAITGLLLLSALPVLGGVLSLREVSADPESTLLLATRVATVAHIVAMSVYCLLGAYQFSSALRTRRGWHRTAGRALILAGFIAARSAVWLAVFFGGPSDELAVAMVRLVFALWTIPIGEVDAFGETWLVAAGFVINSVVAESVIRRRSSRRMSRVVRRRAPVL